jgi:hypothetical protein
MKKEKSCGGVRSSFNFRALREGFLIPLMCVDGFDTHTEIRFDAQHVCLVNAGMITLPLYLPLRDAQTFARERCLSIERLKIFEKRHFLTCDCYPLLQHKFSSINRREIYTQVSHYPSSDNPFLELLPYTFRVIRSHGINERSTWNSQTSIREHALSSELQSDTLSQVHTSSTAERDLECFCLETTNTIEMLPDPWSNLLRVATPRDRFADPSSCSARLLSAENFMQHHRHHNNTTTTPQLRTAAAA